MDALQTEIAALRKDMNALIKLVRKVHTFQEDPTGEKMKERTKNNGFNRPMIVSPELRAFFELGETETISRSAVTRRLNEYIKANNLKHPDNGRIIILDDKLKALLHPPEGVQVTFLNVQKYLSPHYTKVDIVAPEPEPEESVASHVVATAESESEVTSPAPKKVARPSVKKTPKAA
jgi:upstream activation factor subunit UAF30